MPKLTKEALKSILNKKLSLRNPEFHLRKVGVKWAGNVVSPTFKGKDDLERVNLIWKALEKELGEKKAHLEVGFLLAYTPDEWDWGTDIDTPHKMYRANAKA